MRRRITTLSIFALMLAGCNFAGRPSLPKRAAVEPVPAPRDEERFAAIVQQADVIYLATDRLGLALASEPAWQLVRALKKSGANFGVGWGVIENAPEVSFENESDLQITGTVHERENCRIFLRDLKRLGVPQIALGDFQEPPEAGAQFAATQIAAFLRERNEAKLLVLLDRRQMEMHPGIASFVAQKMKARQVILDSNQPATERRDLLTTLYFAGAPRS